MSLKRRVYCRLDDNIEYLRTMKTYVEMLMDRAFMLADFVDEWMPGISPNIHYGSGNSERMTPEFGGYAGPAMDSNPVPQNYRLIGNVSNVGIDPAGTIGSCEHLSQSPSLERDPDAWTMEMSVSCGEADSNPANRHFSSFCPNSNRECVLRIPSVIVKGD